MSEAVERIVLIAKGARGAACAAAVGQALADPNIFVFGELLDLNSVKKLEGTDHDKWFQLLKIFAFSTLAGYTAKKKEMAQLPDLSAPMLQKLRLLTIVELGSQNKTLAYGELLAALGCESLRDLEDIAIRGISLELFGGKLDQKKQQLKLSFVRGRDLKPGDLDAMIGTLDTWCTNCEGLLDSMMEKMKSADASKARDVAEEETIVKDIEEVQKTLSVTDKMDGGLHSDFQSPEFLGEESRVRGMRDKKPSKRGGRRLGGGHRA